MDIDYFSFGFGFLSGMFFPLLDIISVSIIRKRMSNDDGKEERVGE